MRIALHSAGDFLADEKDIFTSGYYWFSIKLFISKILIRKAVVYEFLLFQSAKCDSTCIHMILTILNYNDIIDMNQFINNCLIFKEILL